MDFNTLNETFEQKNATHLNSLKKNENIHNYPT